MIVAHDRLPGEVMVSTIFLGIDHGYGGAPLLFETMIFGGQHDQWQNRYRTFQAAKDGHAEALKIAVS